MLSILIVLCTIVVWGAVRPTSIRKRSVESADALRTLAEDLRIKTTSVNAEYVSDYKGIDLYIIRHFKAKLLQKTKRGITTRLQYIKYGKLVR